MERIELAVFLLKTASALILSGAISCLAWSIFRYVQTEAKFRRVMKEKRIFFRMDDE